MLIGSELLTYRTEVLFLFVYRFLIESNGFELSGPLSTSIIHQVLRKLARFPGPLQRETV